MTRRVALFGKLPAHGDFVTRGLGARERDAIDGWLAASLADARAALGEGFDDVYRQAPPWRFARREADGWQAGAIAPSVDRVGRHYPVMLGIGGLAATDVNGAAQAVERLIRAALGEGWNADRLADAAATCAIQPDSVWTGGDRWWTVGGGTGTGRKGLAGARPPGLMRAVLGDTPGRAGRGGMTAGLRFDYGALSHEGRVRTNNEDAFAVRAADGVFVVADGMGGHEHGEWASAAIVDQIDRTPLPADFDAACATLGDALHAANATIWTEASRRGIQMGSTVVLLLVRDNRFAVLWVGDSRVYILRGGQLVQLSHDHTQVQEMLDRGLLTAEDAEGHPMSHVLARAMGVRDAVEVDVVSDEVEPGDVFLLCSDGLTARVEDHEIAAMLATPDPEARVRRLVELTLERGAPDNVTIISVDAHAVAAPAHSSSFQTVAP